MGDWELELGMWEFRTAKPAPRWTPRTRLDYEMARRASPALREHPLAKMKHQHRLGRRLRLLVLVRWAMQQVQDQE